ncbi:MAG: hypothetical protein WC773_03515 [Patescibacteria group bacterium]|jgi:hypothetical protein
MNEQGFGSPEKEVKSPEEARAEAADRDLRKLAELRESGEIEPEDFPIDTLLQLNEYDQPVARKDAGNQAIVINPGQFEELGYIDFVGAGGELITLDFEDQVTTHPLIIFPSELGDLPENVIPGPAQNL